MPKKRSKKKRRYNPNKHRKTAAKQKRVGISLKSLITEINCLKPVIQAAIAARQRAKKKEGGHFNNDS